MWDVIAQLMAGGKARRQQAAQAPAPSADFGFDPVQPVVSAPDVAAPDTASVPEDVLRELGLDGVARLYAARPWEIGQRLKEKAGEKVMGFFGGGK